MLPSYHVFQGLTPQLFWRHRIQLLACSREELDAVVVKLVAAARKSEQTPDRDRLHGAWSPPPTSVLKVGGRVLLCTLADLPREHQIGVLGTCEPDNDDGETAFIVVYSPNATPPVDNTDKPRPKEPRSRDGEKEPRPDAAPLGEEESGGTSRVLHMHLPPLGRRAQHVFVREVLPRAVAFARSHLDLGRKICVAGGDESIGVALVLLQLFFDDEGSLRSDTMPCGAAARKSSVRTRLEWIIASRPQVNPSRSVLKRVNDFLLSSHSHRQDGEE